MYQYSPNSKEFLFHLNRSTSHVCPRRRQSRALRVIPRSARPLTSPLFFFRPLLCPVLCWAHPVLGVLIPHLAEHPPPQLLFLTPTVVVFCPPSTLQMVFVYTGAGRMGSKNLSEAQSFCVKEACLIQKCLARNGSVESKCLREITFYGACCDRHQARLNKRKQEEEDTAAGKM